MAKLEAWRKTGRRATPEHFVGVAGGVVLEVSLYDRQGSQQGRGVIQLLEKTRGENEIEGQIWRGRFLCIEDGYYEWWAETTFGTRLVPFHLCERNAQQCREASVYRNPVHVDVFRVLPKKSFLNLVWMTEALREKANNTFVPPAEPPPGIGRAGAGVSGTGTPGPGGGGAAASGEEVETGGEGTTGLAGGLWSAGHGSAPDVPSDDKKKRKHGSDDEGEKSRRVQDLKGVISERKAKEPIGSALKMKSESLQHSETSSCSKDLPESDRPGEEDRVDDRMEESARTEDSHHVDGSDGLQDDPSSPGHCGARSEGDRVGHQSRPMDPGKPLEADTARGRAESLVQPGIEGRPTRPSQRTKDGTECLAQTAQNTLESKLLSSSSRGEEGRRSKRRSASREQWRQGQEGERKRQKGQDEMVVDVEARLDYEPLELALKDERIDEDVRERIKEIVVSGEVKSAHALLKRSLGWCPRWEWIEFRFFDILVDEMENGLETAVGKARHLMDFVFEESRPEVNPDYVTFLGVGSPQPVIPSRVGEGQLLGVWQGVEIRAVGKDWTREEGVFVGKPHKDDGSTIYHREFVGQLDKEKVRKSLIGQKLYVKPHEVDEAKWLIEEFRLSAGPSVSSDQWTRMFKVAVATPRSLSLCGVVLMSFIQCRPGEVGNLARALPCCALKTFQRSSVELLPLPLPKLTMKEEQLYNEVCAQLLREGGEIAGESAERQEMIRKLGVKAWTWLQTFVLNYMYCQGVGHRMITDGMMHLEEPTKIQTECLSRLEGFSEKWVNYQADEHISGKSWEEASQDLGDMYTGANIGKSYPLTLKAILPTTPGRGEAARIPMAEVVSYGVKPYVEDPSLLRISDDELIAPRTRAAVQVESQAEWDAIVAHLVSAGMLEREVPSETLCYKGEEVRNGAFGVHKAWILEEDGSWFRTLRLIINMIPANSFQRRMPVRASERMGYAPLWGNLYLHEDEIVICSAEDQKHCFHIYRPGYAWRGFFTLNKKASGACFKDGVAEAAFPRVRSAPMGWNNVVDFIQDGFENMAKEAGLCPSQIIRMNEPSPFSPLATPRSFYSFYVDNYDQLTMIWQTERGIYEGKPSEAQEKLRKQMEALSVGRDPKKAAEGVTSWTSLGAEVDGEAGLVGSSLKFRRGLLSANLGLLAEGLVRTDSLNLQSVVSKNMHSVQYCRPLSSLFDAIYAELNQEKAGALRETARDELLLLTCALPLHWMDLRMKVHGQVFATDASEEGGGACASTQLTEWGAARLHSLSHEVDGIEGGGTEKCLLIEVFAGIGG